MIGDRQQGSGPVRVVPSHRNVVPFTNQAKAKPLERLDDIANGGIDGKPGHQIETAASATKTSTTGASPSMTSLPKLSMWN